jgi:type III secretory pathway component EscV
VRADLEYVSEVLAEAVFRRASPQAKFNRAVELRNEMREAIRAGNAPTSSYRYQWLKDRSSALLDMLSGWGEEFDKQHPDDISTLLDFFDIVTTVRNRLVRQLAQMGCSVTGEPLQDDEEEEDEPEQAPAEDAPGEPPEGSA